MGIRGIGDNRLIVVDGWAPEDLANNVGSSMTQLMMEAARLRDERAAHVQEVTEGSRPARVVSCLTELTELAEGVRAAWVVDWPGEVVAGINLPPATEREGLWQALRPLCRVRSGGGTLRVLIEDGGGTVAVVSLPERFYLVVLADRDSNTGSLSLYVGRAVRRLEEE